ncbi:MAG: ribonuclease HII [Candidatus Omnitrophica bacterium]|nr:ribonuclease HII [Candidatus Omnitrophota bacterium]
MSYERKLKNKGYDLIIGVDEAGRGPLAGPVVAAAVCLKSFKFVHRIDDSKKLTPARRQAAFVEIKSKSLYAIAAVNHIKIDQVNILQATILAMQKAIAGVTKQLTDKELKRAFVLIDGNMRFKLDLPYQSIVGGDGKSLSIAAASILAKERRDQIMAAFHKIYPQYEFIKHKGYPTQLHRAILKERGPIAIHRKSFLRCCQEI